MAQKTKAGRKKPPKDTPWRPVIPPPVQVELDKLAGKKAGTQKHLGELLKDPCARQLGAYRLSGPLQETVCGKRLDNDYRLAFSLQSPDGVDPRPRLVVLYVGLRDHDGARSGDIWELLHDLFGVENPPEDHHKLPCCENGEPQIADEDLEVFLSRLRRLQRGR